VRPLLFYAAAAIIVLSDQVSKWAIVRTFDYGTSVKTAIPYLYLTHTRNTGGAFSLLQAKNHWFIVIAAVAMFALAYAYHRSARRDLWVSGALALALGGAIGNLIDRLRFGYVIDFFDVKVWPVFNVADSAITFGILILAWTFLFKREPAEVEAAEDVPLNATASEGGLPQDPADLASTTDSSTPERLTPNA
jgi:signal peptidase II